MPQKRIPTPSQDAGNWGTILNDHLAQTTNKDNGAFNSFDQFSARPTNLAGDDSGKTYLYTQTGNWHEWSGTEWKVQNKSEINVKDYGAIGDGVTDDTVAIQNCIDLFANSYATIFFSKGIYITSSTILVKTPLSIVGQGNRATTIKPASSLLGPAISYGVVNEVPRPQNTVFENITLDGTNTINNSNHGIFTWSSFVDFNNCLITGFAGYGLYAFQSWSNYYRNMQISYNKSGGIFLGQENNGVTILNTEINWNNGHGITVNGGSGTRIICNNIEQNDFCGVYVEGNDLSAIRHLDISNNYFEENTKLGTNSYGIKAGRFLHGEISNISIKHNYFEGRGQTIYLDDSNGGSIESNGALLKLGYATYSVNTFDQVIDPSSMQVTDNSYKSSFVNHDINNGYTITGRQVGFNLVRENLPGQKIDMFSVKTPTNVDYAEANLNGSLKFVPISQAQAQKNSIFIDNSDLKLKFKDSSGAIKAINLI